MLKEILIFAGGVAIGSASCFWALKNHYERIAQEEIDNMRNELQDRLSEAPEPSKNEEKEEDDISIEMQPETTDISDYKVITKPYDYSGTMNDDMVQAAVITVSDYSDPDYDNYSKVNLVYYEDSVLAYESNGSIIEEPERILGSEWMTRFGEDVAGTVYVRNFDTQTDYEIEQSSDLYSDRE